MCTFSSINIGEATAVPYAVEAEGWYCFGIFLSSYKIIVQSYLTLHTFSAAAHVHFRSFGIVQVTFYNYRQQFAIHDNDKYMIMINKHYTGTSTQTAMPMEDTRFLYYKPRIEKTKKRCNLSHEIIYQYASIINWLIFSQFLYI